MGTLTADEYLRGLYRSNLLAGKALSHASLSNEHSLRVPGTSKKPVINFDDSVANSPRYEHLHQAAKHVTQNVHHVHSAANDTSVAEHDDEKLPHLRSLLQTTLGPYMDGKDDDECIFDALLPVLTEITLMKGAVLWSSQDRPDALFFIESGILKAQYVFTQDDYVVHEAMLAGTIAGELSFLAQQHRNATVTADADTKLWRLDVDSMNKIASENHETYRRLVQVLLRVTADEQSCLMSYLVSRLS